MQAEDQEQTTQRDARENELTVELQAAQTSVQQLKAEAQEQVAERQAREHELSTEIEGKTYYGCCKMCINALNSDPQQRFAVDPVSGKEIDKAEAIIGAAPDNSIYYFETEENLEIFKLAASDEE